MNYREVRKRLDVASFTMDGLVEDEMEYSSGERLVSVAARAQLAVGYALLELALQIDRLGVAVERNTRLR